MTISAIDAANKFIKHALGSGTTVSNLKLQALVYLANEHSLCHTGEPLYHEEARAYPWGPVIPVLYNALRKCGKGGLSEYLPSEKADIAEKSIESIIIKAVWEAYKRLTPRETMALTFLTDSPARMAWNKEKFSVITNDSAKKYYKNFR